MARPPARSPDPFLAPPSGRVLRLPPRGRCLVSTDLHGDLEAFCALRDRFAALLRDHPESHWVQLGDWVHGPDDDTRTYEPRLYGYPDRSWDVLEALWEAQSRWPGRVHGVLGNHDMAHLGGRRTRKFHPDEAAFLEASLSPAQRDTLRARLGAMLLAVVTPCGPLLTHGAPDRRVLSLAQLDRMPLPPATADDQRALDSVLWSYGQAPDEMSALLARLSAEGTPLTFVLHGHDKDEAGWFAEGDNQGCPVIFGAPRAARRCVVLDLEGSYPDVRALREGVEILPVHPAV